MNRINKTENNLKTVWQQLDNASGELYNALENLSLMTGLSDHTKRLMEMIDISRIDLLKENIEQLIEEKEQLDCHQASSYLLKKLNQKGCISWYENADDFYRSNQVDECLLEWEDVVKDWDRQPSRDNVENGFIIIEKGETTYVIWELNKPSLDKFAKKVNDHKEEEK